MKLEWHKGEKLQNIHFWVNYSFCKQRRLETDAISCYTVWKIFKNQRQCLNIKSIIHQKKLIKESHLKNNIISSMAMSCLWYHNVVSCVLTPVFDCSHFILQKKWKVIGCQLLHRCLKGKWEKQIRSKYFHLDQKWSTSTNPEMKGDNKKRWTDTSARLINLTTVGHFEIFSMGR